MFSYYPPIPLKEKKDNNKNTVRMYNSIEIRSSNRMARVTGSAVLNIHVMVQDSEIGKRGQRDSVCACV